MANINYNAAMISSDDKFGSLREVIRKLTNNVMNPHYFISEDSRDRVSTMINDLEVILGLEVALHSQNDTYNPINGVADMENRQINVSRNIDMAEKVLNYEFETTPEQQSGNGQYQQPAFLDQHALSSRDQSDSSSPSNEADDQVSVARSRSSGSNQRTCAPYFCKSENCPTPDKPFKFLSKLRDHERSHQAPSFTCPECNLKFKQTRILKKHMTRVHKHHTQGVPEGTHGTVSDVTYHDLDKTSQMLALNMQAQTLQLHPEAFFGINPDAFRNPELIDFEPGLIPFYPSPEPMSGSDFESILADGNISAGGSPDHMYNITWSNSTPMCLTAGQC